MLRTSIPDTAQEVVHESWETGAKKSADYYLEGQQIGYRSWTRSGTIEMEYGIKDGKMHGPFRTWHENGHLCEEARYVEGKEHGLTKQYDHAGRLLGSYAMEHGTGIDLWLASDGSLSEERHYKDGLRHGYERWWNGDNTTVWKEEHYWQGEAQGIFREWNEHGRLRRGYPRYFVGGERVTKQRYEQACQSATTLPRFDAMDNTPRRELPKAYAEQKEKA
jgi:antitoxin component YwqK of YwqJK toxin-antitoxin module